MALDEIDHKILEVLQRNGRISNQDLADQVGLSPSPCLRRVKAIEKNGVIRGYTALLDPEAIGQAFQVIVDVRLEHQNHAASSHFEKQVLKNPQVLQCYLTAGDWDYVLLVLPETSKSFAAFASMTWRESLA